MSELIGVDNSFKTGIFSERRIETPRETIRMCKEIIFTGNRGAYLRFGDGDINLLEGRNELLQSGNLQIAGEILEAFSLTGNGILKCLPLHSKLFGLMPGMKPGIHEVSDSWASNILARASKFFVGEKIYSPVALAYLAVFERDCALEFLRLLRNMNPIFVGNQNIPSHIIKKLFGETVHIQTPAKQAFTQIDRVESETIDVLKQRDKNYQVIVIAMGCSGRVLAKRLIKNSEFRFFLFDFGSLLDALCGWNTRAWIDLVNKPAQYWEQLLVDIGEDS
jgi:hypothetical protein